jgi:hypothetical protein
MRRVDGGEEGQDRGMEKSMSQRVFALRPGNKKYLGNCVVADKAIETCAKCYTATIQNDTAKSVPTGESGGGAREKKNLGQMRGSGRGWRMEKVEETLKGEVCGASRERDSPREFPHRGAW